MSEPAKQLSVTEYVEKLTGSIMMELQTKQAQGLVIPPRYAANNALMAAMFKIKETVNRDKQPALSVCKPDSIKQAVMEMLTKGLDPNKQMCYFIVYGDRLTLFESYFGIIHRLKEANPEVKDVYSEVVYNRDKFSYSMKQGHKIITNHEQAPENVDLTQIKGAYATIVYKDGSEQSEFMTMQQIRNSWARGQTKGESDAHRLAPEEMAKRTVLKRLIKPILNTENDEEMLSGQLDEINANAESNEATEAIDITPPEQETIAEPAKAAPEVAKPVEKPKQVEKPTATTQAPVPPTPAPVTVADQVQIEMPDVLK